MDTVTKPEVAISEIEDVFISRPGDLPDEEAVGVALTALKDVRDELNAVVLARQGLIDTALICLLTGEHLLQLGAPGTAKSLLMEEIARRVIDPVSGQGLNVFKRLMDKFVTPEMLFGPIDAAQLKNSVYRHLYEGTFATADLVLLDEVFKSSTAILNSLLLAINERRADVGTNLRVDIPLITMFLASNEPPQDVDALLAFYDRILMRMEVRYLEAQDFMTLMASKAAVNRHRMFRSHGHWYAQQQGMDFHEVVGEETPHSHITRSQLYLLQQAVPFVEIKPEIIEALAKIRGELAQKGIVPSDRRWTQLIPVLQASALLKERGEVTDEDLTSIIPALWAKPDEITEITKQVRRAGNPHTAKIKELLETAESTFSSFKKAFSKATTEPDRVTVSADALTNLKAALAELTKLKGNLDTNKQEAAVRSADAAMQAIKGRMLEVSQSLSGV